MIAKRSFMAFKVDDKSCSVGPSAVARLALVGVFGIDMSDLPLILAVALAYVYVCLVLQIAHVAGGF